MMQALYLLLPALRGLIWFASASVHKLLRTEPDDGAFLPQGMCHFCGLITPRRKQYCLECGKSLKSA